MGGLAGVQFANGIKRVINGRPEAMRQNCEDRLRRWFSWHWPQPLTYCVVYPGFGFARASVGS
jgi:hypothetical protein